MAQRNELQTRADESARALAQNDETTLPTEAKLAEAEKSQVDLEEQESLERARLAEFEESHNRAVLDAERSRAEIARLETEIEDDLASGRIVSEIKITCDEKNGVARETAIIVNQDLPHAITFSIGRRSCFVAGRDRRARRTGKRNSAYPQSIEIYGRGESQRAARYDELKARHTFLTEQAADAHHAIEKLNVAITELDQIMREKFQVTFKAVNVEFTKFFTILFNGGTARLEMTNPEDISQTGIDVVARPPGKRSAHLAMLSGGERALTATALLFAILKVSPTPFCVLDEVDAALDEANVARFRDALGR